MTTYPTTSATSENPGPPLALEVCLHEPTLAVGPPTGMITQFLVFLPTFPTLAMAPQAR